MKKTTIIIISVISGIILLCGIFGIGWVVSKKYYQGKKPIIVIKPVGPGTTTVINTPTTPDEWLKWKNAKLEITGKITTKDNFLVSVTDGFKSGTQNFKIDVTCPDEGKNVMIFSYVGGIDYRADTFKWQHGASAAYYRMIIPMVGLGIQVIATESNVFIAPGIIVKF